MVKITVATSRCHAAIRQANDKAPRHPLLIFTFALFAMRACAWLLVLLIALTIIVPTFGQEDVAEKRSQDELYKDQIDEEVPEETIEMDGDVGSEDDAAARREHVHKWRSEFFERTFGDMGGDPDDHPKTKAAANFVKELTAKLQKRVKENKWAEKPSAKEEAFGM